MGYVLRLIYALLHVLEGIVIKEYGKKHSAGGMLVNAIVSLFAMLFFVA